MRSSLSAIVVFAVALPLACHAFAQSAPLTRSVRVTGSPSASPISPAASAPTLPPDFQLPEAENSAGIAVDVLPSAVFDLGAKISFRVSTREPGYLILVDVDSTGKLSQIYPNAISMSGTKGAKESANYIKGSRPTMIPPKPSAAGFQFVTSVPEGTGMVVAFLSDKPIQFMDLPDVPAPLVGQQQALEFLLAATKELKVIPTNDSGRLEDAKWSISSRFYMIK
ncbi:MAG TPA: DUF4384 domain-containing protein [Beijerinckiaceae bacterium]|jgi:hypothetical protein|nr:DUF4384 domain-containing protein [Beijerinckiaceae bacterium]